MRTLRLSTVAAVCALGTVICFVLGAVAMGSSGVGVLIPETGRAEIGPRLWMRPAGCSSLKQELTRCLRTGRAVRRPSRKVGQEISAPHFTDQDVDLILVGPSSIGYPRSASGPYPGGCSTCQASPVAGDSGGPSISTLP
jgi:hypothetical protein